MNYFAHSPPAALNLKWLDPARQAEWEAKAEPLVAHLRAVAGRAKALAEAATGPGSPLAAAAYAAGLLHDLGKYRPEFQAYIRGGPPYKGDPRTRHKEAGAAKVLFPPANNLPLGFAILGHHGGMPDKVDAANAAKGESGKAVADAVWAAAVADCPDLAGLSPAPPPLDNDPFRYDLFTRLLFSCLVDADWTATAAYERQAKGEPPESDPPPLDPAGRLARVLAHIDAKARAVGETTVGRVRQEVLAACQAAAEQPPGVFTLTVPTGGGKTLSGLAFALKHAKAHGLRRVIYVAPYLSIIEQNARVIRDALGVGRDDPDVFEHHSLADPPADRDPKHPDRDDPDETRREAAARRAENWDAPVVVTTNVQFFESLFSNKPGRCRKLHNVARSVVLLDECQSLPPGLVAPTCQMLKQFSHTFNTTVVLCTATQPAFDHPSLGADRLTATPIVTDGMNLFSRLKRVELDWRIGKEPMTWAEVAARMRKERSALCVVNTKRAARELFEELRRADPAGVFHLSTAMCPAHRLAKLDAIRSLLRLGAPCYVVSTQLIEAGVDVSFPFLMREMGPLESVIQAAGRCNREGELGDGRYGRVEVFEHPDRRMPPDEWYTRGRAILDADFLKDGYEPQIDRPGDIQLYYRKLYRVGNLDRYSIQAKRLEEKFATVAEEYKLIKDDTVPVVVGTWKARAEEIGALLAEVAARPRRAPFRRLSLFQVNVYRSELAKLMPHLREGAHDLLIWTSEYDESLGTVPEITWEAIV